MNFIKGIKELLQGIIESIGIILDKEALKAIREAERDIKEGRVRRLEDFLSELSMGQKH